MICLKDWQKEDRFVRTGPGRIIRIDKPVFLELSKTSEKKYTKVRIWVDIILIAMFIVLFLSIIIKYLLYLF